MATTSHHLRRLSSESAIYGLSQAVAQFSGLILTPLYGHRLLPAELGSVALANTLLGLFGMLLVLGLDNSTHRWFWDREDAGDRVLTLNAWFWPYLLLSAVCAGVLLLFQRPLGEYLGLPAYGVFLVCSQLVTRVVINVATNWFRLQRRPWMVLAINLGAFCSTTALTVVLLLWMERGVVGVFEAQAAALLLQAVVTFCLLRAQVRWDAFRWLRFREMLAFALPLLPAGLLMWGINLSDRVLLERVSGIDEVGVYQIASVVAMLIGMPIVAFQQAWGPFALSIHKQDAAEGVYSTVLFVGALLASVVSLWCVLASPWIISLIATPAYRTAAAYMPWLTFAHVFMALFSVVALGSNLAKSSRSVAKAVLVGACAKLAGALLLIPLFGAIGVVASTTVGLSAMVLWMYRLSQRDWPLRLAGWRTAAVTGGMFVLALGVERVGVQPGSGLWLLLLAGSVSGGAALIAIRALQSARHPANTGSSQA